MLGKQSYLATRQGKIKGARSEGGEEQSLCCPLCSPHVPGWAQVQVQGGCPKLVPLLCHQHHLSSSPTLIWRLCNEPPPLRGVGTVPSHSSCSTFSKRPCKDSVQTIPEHRFQLVPGSLFQLHPGSLKSHQNLSLKCHMMKQLDWSCGGTSEGQLHSLHKKH